MRPLTETSCSRAGFEGRMGSVRNVDPAPPSPNLDPERFTMPGTLHMGGMCPMHFKLNLLFLSRRKIWLVCERCKHEFLFETFQPGRQGDYFFRRSSFSGNFLWEKRQAKSTYYLPPNQNVWYFWLGPRLQSLSGVQIHFKMTDLQRIFRLLHGGATRVHV